MNMQIKLIALYNAEGKIRILPFRLGAVNIITGKSSTGKSTIIEIVDYCLGRSTFKVPVGVIQDTVKWYAVLFQIGDTEVFVAKPAPEGSQIRQSLVYYEVGTRLAPPPFSSLVPNADDDALIEYLSALIGISPNLHIPDKEQTRSALAATIRHTSFYLFQKQNVITSQDVLFHRQSESFIPQAIKDTLPYFLGAVREDFLKLSQELQIARRKLRRAQRKLQEAELVVSSKVVRGESLVAEAQQVGLINPEFSSEDIDEVLKVLGGTSSWKPTIPPLKGEDRFDQLQEEREQLWQELRRKHEQIVASESFAKEAKGYSSEADQQRMRLEAIGVFEADNAVDICPLCSSELSQATVPTTAAITESLRNLQDNLRTVDSEKPRLREYIQSLKDEQEELREKITEKETIIAAILEEQTAADEIRDTNARIARVVGRISLYLETFELVDESSPLRQEVEEAKEQVDNHERLLNPDEMEEVRTSLLNRIGMQMTKLAEQLELEHQGNPYRLDPKRLTVVVDQDPPAPLDRIGGGENWLGCHLIALLALHKHFIEQNRPVPGFLILDQPSQVYFPSLSSYQAMEGKAEAEMIEANADIIAMRRLFDLLFDFCEEMYPNFQIIVTEHANMDDTRFQQALVEGPWMGGRALIPENWISEW